MRLAPPADLRNLGELAQAHDPDTTLALAELMGRLQVFQSAGAGAAAGVYASRMDGFSRAVADYQDALLRYRKAVETDASEAVRRMAKEHVLQRFGEMQRSFRVELDAIRLRVRSRRGLPLTNPQRALNIATSSRGVSKLHVSNQAEAHALVKYSRYAKHLGSGLAVVDFGAGVGRIHNSYQAGGEWEREMFVESATFAVGASAGGITAYAGSIALSILIASTPIGWVGVLVGGALVAASSAAVSLGSAGATRKEAGPLYDELMSAGGRLWK
ncbi:hypothetical protein [Alkalilimnicola sp. S0819]|uniref:hypothetical protein n=1 Tax=Alkalilimnicola sp. S0819 TaxID=2613922 RepID=UPI001261AF1F|nr:hypothetical protein [Alkalilimnicola sp. S0819]KAB7627274.1 hypothetical protein F3N43_05000 [Alkalilimnicola sp. S0819]MPQ15987.1 hypothetical protein [Alkalilimnicola sp. S0819]